MNALGLPGASIDGILGFTILARYRLEIDPTEDRMTWTRLDYEPREPPVPGSRAGRGGERRRLGVRAMNALGPLAKGLAFLMGKQPEEERHPRGFLGLEWAALVGVGAGPRRAPRPSRARRLARRPGRASRPTIVVLRINGRAVDGLKAARVALAEVRPGDSVTLLVRRGSGADARELKLVPHRRGGPLSHGSPIRFRPLVTSTSGPARPRSPAPS